MALTIPDEILKQSGLSERDMAIEIACRLFAAQVLSKGEACQLCGLTRVEFEEECYKRDMPVYIYTREMLEQDLKFAQATGGERAGR